MRTRSPKRAAQIRLAGSHTHTHKKGNRIKVNHMFLSYWRGRRPSPASGFDGTMELHSGAASEYVCTLGCHHCSAQVS